MARVSAQHRSDAKMSSGGVAEWTNAVVLKLAAIDVSASDRTLATLKTAALSRWGRCKPQRKPQVRRDAIDRADCLSGCPWAAGFGSTNIGSGPPGTDGTHQGDNDNGRRPHRRRIL